jgi:hypothetical protein
MDTGILERWARAHKEGDTETLAECMDEGFVFEQEGLSHELGKEEYIELVDAMHRAFPDLAVEFGPESVDEDGTVEHEQALTATHEHDLDLTELGLPFLMSTGNEIELSADAARTRVDGGRITEHAIDDPSAGIAGLLDELETGLEAIRREAEDHEPNAPGL